MGKVWKALLILAVAVLGLVAILVYRTLTFTPPVADYSGQPIRDIPVVDADRAGQRLAQAIRFRTISEDTDTGNRTEFARFRDWIATTYPLAAAAMQRELIAGDTTLYTWPGSDAQRPPIMLMAHQDVVPVTAETEDDWKHPPFDGVIADGAIWGRGAIDDKGSLIAIFEAAETLLEAGFRPNRTVMIVNSHDEESAQSGSEAVAALLQSRGITLEFVLDEGLVVLADAPVVNGPVALVGIAEKGYASLKVTARSAGGHSSTPPEDTAVEVLARAIIAITENGDPFTLDGPGGQSVRAMAGSASFLTRLAVANEWLFRPLLISQITRTPAGAALLHTTIAPTVLRASPKENVLAQVAEALINYRIVPGQTMESVLARAKQIVEGLGVEVTLRPGYGKQPSPVSSHTSDAFKLIAAIASQGGTIPVVPGLVLASTDSSHLTPVARDIYRFQPIVLTLAETAMIHGTDEHMTFDNLRRMVEFYARLIATSAG